MTERLELSPATAAAAVMALGLMTILGAWGFELIAGLAPCPLCLEQRIPYYAGIPLAGLALLATWRGPRWLAGLLLAATAGLMLWGAGLGVYHSGIEWALWEGPPTCAGLGEPMPTDAGALLDGLGGSAVPRCSEAAWRFLGLSLAGYNALISLALAGLAGLGAFAAFRRPAHG